MIPSTAQWDRIGTVAVGATVRFPDEPGKVRKSSTLLYYFQKYFWNSTLLHSPEKKTFENTLTWKTLSVKLLWKLINFPYQILELELELLFIFYKEKELRN